MSLSALTSVKQEELREKFRLEPMYQYDRNEKDNRVFMSPTILLGESELRHGGHLELDAKKVLSLVTKDILESKDYTLFQIPEITCLHMGYGKKSANKEGKMALSETDAKTWFNVLNLSTLQSLHKSVQANIDAPPIGRDTKVEGEVTEAMEIGFQPRRTNQIYDDTVSPCYSGLLIPEKGSNILCLSILILNSEIRSQKQRKKSNHFESSESEEWVPEVDDIELKGKIGANKISDFLSFWTLPYLLNYTQRKIQEIAKHHEANKRDPKSHMKTVKKSAWDIILDATHSKPEFRPKLKEKLEQYYTTEKLHKEYTLLKGNDGSPIVLVPLEYVFDTGNPHPLRLEDLGRKWEWEGRVLSNKEFLINAFVKQKEVQMDYFNCMKDAELRQGVDYAFIFPGKVEFEVFFKEVIEANPNVLTTLKHVESQGRGQISPRHSVVQCSGQNLVVCFSYFQGADKGSVAALFRAVGAHYFNHFTAVFLHGSTLSKRDSDCQLGNLYPVRVAEKLSFKQGKLMKSKTDKISFRKGVSRFVEHDFPKSHGWWMEKIFADPDVRIAIKQFDINPAFDPSKHLKVAFSKMVQKEDLKNVCLANGKRLVKRQIGAANFNGHLLSMIQQCGRKDNIGVTLAISSTVGTDDPPPVLTMALTRIICYFVLAIIKAEPQLVFPSEPDKEDREKIDSDSSQSSTSDSDEEDYEPAAKYVRKPLSGNKVPVKRGRQDRADHRPDSGNSDSSVQPVEKRRPPVVGRKVDSSDDMNEDDSGGLACGDVKDSDDHDCKVQAEDDDNHSNNRKEIEEQEHEVLSKSEQKLSFSPARASVASHPEETPQLFFKEGVPTPLELSRLAGKIASKWEILGLHLGIEQELLEEITANAKDKPYEMLLHWSRNINLCVPTSCAAYHQLYNALCEGRVGRSDLARDFCCKKTT